MPSILRSEDYEEFLVRVLAALVNANCNCACGVRTAMPAERFMG